MKKVLFFTIIGLLALCSCQQQKEYKYIEQESEKSIFGGTSIKEKEVQLIYAASDTSAYIEAYNIYARSIAAHKRSRQELNQAGLPFEEWSTPVGFKLLNSEGQDISSIHFTTKTQLEQEITAKWNEYVTPAE